jgi:hypothetical protein
LFANAGKMWVLGQILPKEPNFYLEFGFEVVSVSPGLSLQVIILPYDHAHRQ